MRARSRTRSLVGWLLAPVALGGTLAAAALACTGEPSPTGPGTTREVPLGESFTLRIGETVTVEGTDLALTFAEVRDDSRCPPDVTCVWAGEAVVLVEARRDGRRTDLVFRVPPGGSDEAELDDLRIRLTSLEPPTRSDRPLDPSEYRATFLVTT